MHPSRGLLLADGILVMCWCGLHVAHQTVPHPRSVLPASPVPSEPCRNSNTLVTEAMSSEELLCHQLAAAPVTAIWGPHPQPTAPQPFLPIYGEMLCLASSLTILPAHVKQVQHPCPNRG